MAELTLYTRQDIFTDTTDEVRNAKEFYTKSSVDNKIAELQTKLTLASLAEDCSSLRHKRCNYCSELQYQKYKRCLSMANSCIDKIKYWHIRYTNAAGYDRSYEKWKHRLLNKWRKRWLDIAEKFKETYK